MTLSGPGLGAYPTLFSPGKIGAVTLANRTIVSPMTRTSATDDGCVTERQWVISLPYRLRYRLAWDHDLCRAVVAVYMRAVLGWLRRRALLDEGIDGRGRQLCWLGWPRPRCRAAWRPYPSRGCRARRSDAARARPLSRAVERL
jgi:hypothetical protein